VGGWVGVVWGKGGLRSACDKYDVLLDLRYLPKKVSCITEGRTKKSLVDSHFWMIHSL
jgi:hypothetical protein